MEIYSFANCDLCKGIINLDLDDYKVYKPFVECELVTQPHLLICEKCHKKLYKKLDKNIY